MRFTREIDSFPHEKVFSIVRNCMSTTAYPSRVLCYDFWAYSTQTVNGGIDAAYKHDAQLPGSAMAGVVVDRPIAPGQFGWVQNHGYVSELFVVCTYNFTETHLRHMILYPANVAVTGSTAGVVTTLYMSGTTYMSGSAAGAVGLILLCSSSYVRTIFTGTPSGLIFSAYLRML